ncbi:hypothetical protein HYH03_008560 [Edaphochlamys debaryana]|uniref:TauD/TfdA-like domain-containing protein n=1 Tax=Edaphochlamys debaryana TaxID=47281 RepID=A0A836BXU7_9CHLO|nr:hypothetical protein HYH03_008560 [Edaphochlamys debaryana]|eukprot:KAG2493136.1 hypothetical protein HYH03_008560 [Edaphochlamys debaryana]
MHPSLAARKAAGRRMGAPAATLHAPCSAGTPSESPTPGSSALPATPDLPPARTGRAVWYGPDIMSRPDEWIVSLTEAHVAEVEAAVAKVLAEAEAAAAAASLPVDGSGRAGGGGGGGEEAVKLATQRLARLTAADFPLPTLGPVLESLRGELLEGRGFALIRRLPVERYSRLQAVASFMGIGAHLGTARSQNAKGHVLGHVADLGLSSTDPRVRIYQTRERQTFHTDSCDVVGLLCLREAKQGGDSLLAMPHDRRGEVPAGQRPWFDIPVFSWHDPHVSVFYQRQYFDSAQRFPEARQLTTEDVEALDAFDALANDPTLHLTMRLAPGDMQFVHNHNMLHDRTGFDDGPDATAETRRHLLRLWLAAPGARPLPEAFAARYGSLQVGSRGGIEVPGAIMHVPLEPA